MLSSSIIKTLEVYGIAIVISFLVAILIKILVGVTGRIEKHAPGATITPSAPSAPTAPLSASAVSEEEEDILAVIAAAVAAMGSHRILHIAESRRGWMYEGRAALHSHQPLHPH